MSHLAQFVQDRKIAIDPQGQTLIAMTHVIYGYPTVEKSLQWMARLLAQGVDILEVQFPFSDPVADGPAIVAACHQALQCELDMQACLNDLKTLKATYPKTEILLMSYLNPVYRFGIPKLVEAAANAGIAGLIVPDLPIELGDDYQAACETHQIDPIWLVTPITPIERQHRIAQRATGMLYCVSRSGVTGQKDGGVLALTDYLTPLREQTQAPLAVGFGIRTRDQITALNGLADIAIVGSALLDAYNDGGEEQGITMIKTLFPHLE